MTVALYHLVSPYMGHCGRLELVTLSTLISKSAVMVKVCARRAKNKKDVLPTVFFAPVEIFVL